MMQKSFLLFFTLLAMALQAQTYDVGLSLGNVNYIGDVGNSNFIHSSNTAAAVVAKWNRSKRHSFRFSALFADISGNDSDSKDARKVARDFSFENSIKELSLGLEYTFWEWDLWGTNSKAKQTVPYLYSGITFFHHDQLALAADGIFKAYDRSWTPAIPFVIGVKTNLSRHLVFAAELGSRYTFTDNLDGSSPDSLELPIDKNLSFGNANNNDWYFYTGVTLSYTFGRKPCYCIF